MRVKKGPVAIAKPETKPSGTEAVRMEKVQEKKPTGKAEEGKLPPVQAPLVGKRTREQVKDAFKAQRLKKRKSSASADKGPVGKKEDRIEIPVYNVDETPSPVPERIHSPAMVETMESDPIMEELLRQKQQLLEEIEQQKRSYEEEIKKKKEILEQQRAKIVKRRGNGKNSKSSRRGKGRSSRSRRK